jgi:hypothetical protein
MTKSRGIRKPFTEEEQNAICVEYSGGALMGSLTEKYRRSANTIRKCLVAHGVQSIDHHVGPSKYIYNTQVFTNEDDISYYLLGVFMTDGCVRLDVQKRKGKEYPYYRVSLTSKDGDWMETITDLICTGRKPTERKTRNCYEVEFNSGEIAQWLMSKGCLPRKSLTLQFPDVPPQYLPDFLRGVIDGDGMVSMTKPGRIMTMRCAVFTGSLDFANGIETAIRTLGVESKILVRKMQPRLIGDRMVLSERDNYAVRLKNGENACKLLKLAYYSGHRLALARKAKTAQELIAYWEREFRCVDCDQLLVIGKRSRCTKYCDGCRITRTTTRIQ